MVSRTSSTLVHGLIVAGRTTSFYCIVLLSALFMSSCYWPPVPLESKLAVPWSSNTTTYAEVLATLIPDLPEDLKPVDVPMLDRCWCDFSNNGFFDYFNVTDWERQSILRLKDRLEAQIRAREAEKPAEPEPEPVEEPTEADESPSEETPSNSTETTDDNSRSKLSGLWNKVPSWPFSRKPSPTSTSEPTPGETIFIRATPTQRWPWSRVDDYTPRVRRIIPDIPKRMPPFNPEPMQPRRRRKEFDLRPYGLSLILDFSWEKSDT
ncbi:hypothetical protein EVJ58_g29 [Rhodofomes roseus]|uniref:Uncharacterized protein n=1 Tax=Rhodofomes roseus TaxID=34475 RepID=A0A4Y9Z8D0_9APHY|nr:hypothetical protein EVJ58_g29 [Rhodofomes roseus]